MVTHSHAKHRDRMRERVLKEGADGLAKHELLEMLLYGTIPQKNTNDIAHDLLNEFGSLTNLIEADPKEIQKTAGVGINSAIFLSLLHELVRRYDEEKLEQKTYEEWAPLFEKYDVPGEKIMGVIESINHPQAVANHYSQPVEYSDRTVNFPAPPIQLSTLTEPAKRTAAPKIGQHTREVLAQYGFSDGEVEALIAEGAVKAV